MRQIRREKWGSSWSTWHSGFSTYKLCIISCLLKSLSQRSVHIKHFIKENEVWFVPVWICAFSRHLSHTKFWKCWRLGVKQGCSRTHCYGNSDHWGLSLLVSSSWFHIVKMQIWQEQQCFTGGKAGMMNVLIWSVQTGQTPCFTS